MKNQKNQNSKQNKSNVRVSRATKIPATPATPAAPAPTSAQAQLDAKRAEAGKPVDRVAAALNAGQKLTFPKGANAVKAGYAGGKSTVVLKDDADTLKGTGVETAEFGNVPNDTKGHPQRDKFQALSAPEKPAEAGKASKPAKTEKTPQTPAEKPANGNPYKAGSKRAAVYDLGAAGYKDATALVEKVIAALKVGKGKAEKLAKLVADPKARFNEGSKEVKTDGGLKLIAA